MSYISNFVGKIKHYTAGSLFKQTGDVTIANTVTETTLIDTGVGSLTIPANWLVVGRGLRVTARGYHSSSGNPTVTLRVKLGAVTLATASTAGGNGTNDAWEVSIDVVCRTIGGSGTVVVAGYYAEHHSNGAQVGFSATSPVTVNTTISNVFDLTFEWGTASASNTITSQILLLHAID